MNMGKAFEVRLQTILACLRVHTGVGVLSLQERSHYTRVRVCVCRAVPVHCDVLGLQVRACAFGVGRKQD